ncbi:MAG: lipopolysaccharide biosynthesis protein [Fidelibacterota bacterium]
MFNTSQLGNKLYKETLAYVFTKAFPGITGLLSVILFFRLVGPVEYGRFSLLFLFANMCSAFSFGWLNQAILRYYSKVSNHSRLLNIASKGFALSGVFCILLIAIFQWFSFPQNSSILMLIILSIMIGIFSLSNIFYQARQQPLMVVKLTSLQGLLSVGIPLIFIWLLSKEHTSIIWGFALAYALPVLLLFKYWNNEMPKNKSNTHEVQLFSFFRYGWPLSFWFVANISLRFLDRFFIERFLDTSIMGSYASFVDLITRIFSLILFPITMALHPRIMNKWNNNNLKGAVRDFKKGLKYQLVIFAICLSIFYLFDQQIFQIIIRLIPEVDLSIKPILIPVLIGGFLWQFALLIHKPLELSEKSGIMLLCISVSVLVNISGNIIFLPIYGIIATAYTMVVSGSVYIIMAVLFAGDLLNKIKKI